MSYHVDPTTLLFDGLTSEEALYLRIEVEDLVLRGITGNAYRSDAFVAWTTAAGYDDRQALLVLATAYPQRALLSLVRYYTTSS